MANQTRLFIYRAFDADKDIYDDAENGRYYTKEQLPQIRKDFTEEELSNSHIFMLIGDVIIGSVDAKAFVAKQIKLRLRPRSNSSKIAKKRGRPRKGGEKKWN